MSTDLVRRVSTSEAVVEHILTRIRRGEFGPGDWLPGERHLQEQLKIGRLALREGLARLSALGIIRVDHGKGAQIQAHASSDAISQALVPMFCDRDAGAMQNVIDARGLIQAELAARAAARRSDEEIRRLATILDQPGEAATDHHALVALDDRFHHEIAGIADNAFLAVLLDALSAHVGPLRLHFVRSQQDPQAVIHSYRPLLQAIIDGSPEQARECVERATDLYRSSLEDFAQGGAEQGGE